MNVEFDAVAVVCGCYEWCHGRYGDSFAPTSGGVIGDECDGFVAVEAPASLRARCRLCEWARCGATMLVVELITYHVIVVVAAAGI